MTTKEKILKLEQALIELKREVNKAELTKFTFQGKEYELSENLGEMTWQEGKDLCEEMGGKLLPSWLLVAIATEPELKKLKDIFGTGYLWSATENSETNARNVNFSDGYTSGNNKTNSYSVRCVFGL